MKRVVGVLAVAALCAMLACEQGTQQPSGGPTGTQTKNIQPAPGQPGTTPPAATPVPAPATLAAPEAGAGVTIRYAVVLEGAEASTNAPENLTFATDTRFRLLLTPSDDLYIYLIHQGTDGTYALLQPLPGQATSIDRLAAGRMQPIPMTGWFRFDAQAGTEKIFVIASASKIERMELLLEQGQPQSPAIGQTLEAMQQRVEAGYSVNKKVGAAFSELTATGERAKSAVIIGQIDMRHK